MEIKNNSKNKRTIGRKRGVTASRVKLERAMLKAGFKTQTALAQKIAENENLDLENPPRDMVNRVFREVSVDPHTLERVANALSVNAYELMLTSDEVTDHLTVEEPIAQQQAPVSAKFIVYGAVAFVLVMSITLLGLNSYSGLSEKTSITKSISDKPLKIAIIGANSDYLPGFQKSVGSYLGDDFNIQTSDISPIESKVQPWQMAEKLNVDYILEVKFLSEGRYQAIIISMLNSNQKQVVYTNAWTLVTLTSKTDEIARNSSQFIQDFLETGDNNIKANSSVQMNSIPEKALFAYIKGMGELDKPWTNFYLNQSLTQLNRALRISPSFFKARAGLCEALVALYVSTKDISLLSEAESECNKIASIAGDLPEYNYAIGQLKRKQGKLDQAVASFETALTSSNQYVKAMMGMAETYVVMASKKQDLTYFSKAIELMNKAETYAPGFWKPSFVRGRVHYYSGDPKSAIEASEKSVSIEKYWANLNNLANFHFCYGDRNRAKQFYLDASLLNHSPPVAQYQLGSIYTSFKQYDLASIAGDRYRQQVKSEGSEISIDGWLGLGDIYEGNEELEKARQAYTAAYQGGEKLRLNGDDSLSLKVKILYSKLALERLGSDEIPEQQLQLYQTQFLGMQQKNKDPNITFLILQAFYFMENWEIVKKLYDLIAPVCKGFADHPDLLRFKTEVS